MLNSIKFKRTVTFMIGLNAIILLATGCKPQQVITDRESSAILELQDSLMISETQIVLINTITNHLRNEDFNLNNETVIHEIEYGADSRISSERFINSSTKFEKSLKDSAISYRELSSEYNHLVDLHSNLQLETEELMKKENKQRSTSKNFKIVLVVILVVLLTIKLIIN